MNSDTTSNGLVRVEFVCLSCKEGKHGCLGHRTGLGLEIWCTCICVVTGGRKSNNNRHDDNDDDRNHIATISMRADPPMSLANSSSNTGNKKSSLDGNIGSWRLSYEQIPFDTPKLAVQHAIEFHNCGAVCVPGGQTNLTAYQWWH